MFAKNQERQRIIAFIFLHMIQFPRTLNNNIYYSNKRGPSPFFHPDTNPAISHALVYSVDKTHVLFVTVEFIWLLFLNIFSFNFVSTPGKSLRFRRSRRTYVNRPAVILTNHCQSYTAFLLNARGSKWPRSFFCSCWFPMIVYLRC